MNGAATGTSGLFVVPSTALTTAPAFVETTGAPTILGIAESATLSGSTVTNYSPGALMYVAPGTDGNSHVYGLNLTTATTPAPVQLSNYSTSNTTHLCDYTTSQHNFFQPTTMFAVLHVSDNTNTCNTTTASGDVWEVVEFTASATTAPTPVSITTTGIEYFFDPTGALSGLMLLDPASQNVYFYNSNGFTGTPITIASGMGFASPVLEAQTGSSNSLTFSGSLLFEALTTSASVSPTQYLYRIKYDGTFTNVYTATDGVGDGVADSTNMYFTDRDLVYAEPLAGGTPSKLYNGPVDWTLVGSNGSLLVMQNNGVNGTGSVASLVTIPTAGLTSTPTLLGGTPNGSSNFTGSIDTTMVPSTFGTPSTSVVFVSVTNQTGSGLSTTATYASAAYLPSGTVKQALTNNSVFLASSTALVPSVFSITGITDNSIATGQATYGGGTLSKVDVASFAASAMMTPQAAAYTVPTGSFLSLFPVSPTVGPGLVVTPGSGSVTTVESGTAFDLSQNLIVPITVPNSNVTPF